MLKLIILKNDFLMQKLIKSKKASILALKVPFLTLYIDF
ncbi:hypothetical protein VFMJ11_0471 [Aliivibrio fischeri MJ11]|uniref:Uncharacterized protein n=1 Tax=Aliivibrio fischeri (strain MJ11) TaxID=388396 RepID=B5FA65_ALIFM|nr:hypothetical protein VFMJ11_0471 [Aliivibrio fischeri MJ11]